MKYTNDWQDIASPLVLLLTGIIVTGAVCLNVLSLDLIQNLWPAAFALVG